MRNLRNSDLRIRDIRKLIGYKSYNITWDKGCDETSEWVIASVENQKYFERLTNWLGSKKISPENEALLVVGSWASIERIHWINILESPINYFGKGLFHLYDLDLNWVIEIHQEIARFGRYRNN